MARRSHNNKGFTLIELMMVVSFIGILSAIAIPNYLKFRIITKATEAKFNLGAIRTLEESYNSEHNVYLRCNPCPTLIPRKSKVPFEGENKPDFDNLGFEPEGNVWFQYSVILEDIGPLLYLCLAEGDLDGDYINGKFTVDNVSSKIIHVTENIY
ncbi:MAG: type IV pilin protein [bacterium]